MCKSIQKAGELLIIMIELIYEKFKILTLLIRLAVRPIQKSENCATVFVRLGACIPNRIIIIISFCMVKLFYKEEVGAGTAVKETPEIERVKKNQQNISSVSVSNIYYSPLE